MRRNFVVLACACLLILAACSSNKDKDVDSKVANLVEYEKSAKVSRVWTKDIGAGKQQKYLRLTTAIVGDTIYAANADGEVFALDLESGKRRWKTDTKFRISGGVSAFSGILTFGTLEGEVVALNSETGEQLWVAQASSEILAAPAINARAVVVQTIDARVFAFDSDTGKQLWTYDHLTPVLSLRGTSAPVIISNQVVCAFDNGQIVSFSLTDGSRTWEQRISQPKGKTDLERIVDIDGTPLVEGGLVFAAGYQGSVMGFSRAQGNPIWKKAMSTYQRLDTADGKLFISTARSSVVAISLSNGDELWRVDTLLNREITAPIAIGNYLAVIDKDDYLHVLSQTDGSVAARIKPKGSSFHGPMTEYLGIIYLLSDDGKLSAYEIKAL